MRPSSGISALSLFLAHCSLLFAPSVYGSGVGLAIAYWGLLAKGKGPSGKGIPRGVAVRTPRGVVGMVCLIALILTTGKRHGL